MEKLSTLLYSIGQGFKNIKRNKWFSLTSVCTITACLFLFGIFFFLISNVNYMVKHMGSSVAITAFLDENVTDSQIAMIGLELEGRSDIEKVEFISADQAWDKFKSDIFEDQEELVDTFSSENPLQDSESYEIYVKDIADQDQLIKTLEKMDGVRKVNSSDTTVKALTTFGNLISFVSMFIIIMLISVSIFLISTTITVGISVRKDEIAIMRYIGATDFFVQGPFLVEGIMIGLIGACIPLVILVFLYYRLIGWITERFALLSDWLVFIDLKTEFIYLVPICLAMGVGIGLIGSVFTVKKHLHV